MDNIMQHQNLLGSQTFSVSKPSITVRFSESGDWQLWYIVSVFFEGLFADN